VQVAILDPPAAIADALLARAGAAIAARDGAVQKPVRARSDRAEVHF
jgi:hypothetical protein